MTETIVQQAIEVPVTEAALDVLDLGGIQTAGMPLNTTDEQIAEQVKASIRLGYPQVKPQPLQPKRVCLLGGGPSLDPAYPELRDLVYGGAMVVTVNGAYHWALEHNLKVSAQIVLDARPSNARFVEPAIPDCKYLIASQCHADTWAVVQGRPDVWIWHATHADNPVLKPILDEYYLGQWVSSQGGSTVIMRAILLLRTLGYLRFDLFGVDSCVTDGRHHAYAQPENDQDAIRPVEVYPEGHPELMRTFRCAPWHVKQLECFLQTIRLHGDKFLIRVHGDGLLATVLQSAAGVVIQEQS